MCTTVTEKLLEVTNLVHLYVIPLPVLVLVHHTTYHTTLNKLVKRHSLPLLSSFVFFLLSFLHTIKKKTKKKIRERTHTKKNQKNLLLFSKSLFVCLSLFFRSTSGVCDVLASSGCVLRDLSSAAAETHRGGGGGGETRDALLFSICPNCKHATTRTTRRRRERRRDDDDDEEESAETKSASPLTLCEMCQYIFISKDFEENLDPDVPMSLVSPSAPRRRRAPTRRRRRHQRVETRKYSESASAVVLFVR